MDTESAAVRLEKIAWTWSFSKFKCWKECNERFVREYFWGQRPVLPQRPFVQGSIAHELIELGRGAILEGKADDLAAWCSTNLDGVFEKHTAKVSDWKPGELDVARIEAHQLALNYSDLVTKNDLLTSQVKCEHTIGTHQNPLILDNGLRLTGFIDWLKLDANCGVVYDAKTSQSMRWLDRDQLIFYAIAAETEFKIPVGQVNWMMIRKGETVSYNITEDDKQGLINRLLTASKQAANLDLKVFPGANQCEPCPHSGVCNRYANWLLDAGGPNMEDNW